MEGREERESARERERHSDSEGVRRECDDKTITVSSVCHDVTVRRVCQDQTPSVSHFVSNFALYNLLSVLEKPAHLSLAPLHPTLYHTLYHP